MTDNWTRNPSNARSGGRWPVGKTGRKAQPLPYRKLDRAELDAIGRLAGIKSVNSDKQDTFYYRTRTQKVAQCSAWLPDETYESLQKRVETALEGSPYMLLGVSRSYEYGWPWTIEVVAR